MLRHGTYAEELQQAEKPATAARTADGRAGADSLFTGGKAGQRAVPECGNEGADSGKGKRTRNEHLNFWRMEKENMNGGSVYVTVDGHFNPIHISMKGEGKEGFLDFM